MKVTKPNSRTTKMKTLLVITTGLLLNCVAANATDTYLCRVDHKTYPVTIDEGKGTLTWRGTTFQNLKDASIEDCAKFGRQTVQRCM
jgi:hypothetical protein